MKCLTPLQFWKKHKKGKTGKYLCCIFRFYSYSIAGIFILNLFSMIKELLFGIVNYEHILLTIASNFIVVIVIFFISRVLFMKDKWVMN